MFLNTALTQLSEGKSLTEEESSEVVKLLASQDTQESEIRSFLQYSAKRLPTAAELAGTALGLRSIMKPIELNSISNSTVLIDCCGTGGSGKNTFNTSTAVAFVLAASGLSVAKHGNRAVTSTTGSADILESLGIRIDFPPAGAARMLEETGFTFLFAPHYHTATARVAKIRRELGLRTVFNFVGPLTNPAGVKYQLIGVSQLQMIRPMAEAAKHLGSESVVVACGADGLDECTLSGITHLCELKNGIISEELIDPVSVGLGPYTEEEFAGGDLDFNRTQLREILLGRSSAHAELVRFNAGVGLYVGKLASSVAEGVELAQKIIQSGNAYKKLQEVVKWCQEFRT